MVIPDKIFEKYRSALIGEPGEEMYVEGKAALSIPVDCESANLALYGLDTFTIIPGATYPHLDGIMDYSPRVRKPWDDFRQTCNRDALQFMQEMLAQKGANTYFSFVMADADEYESSLRSLR
jgi:hypothetical protein